MVENQNIRYVLQRTIVLYFTHKCIRSQLQKFHKFFYINPKTETETNVINLSAYHGTDLRTPLS